MLVDVTHRLNRHRKQPDGEDLLVPIAPQKRPDLARLANSTGVTTADLATYIQYNKEHRYSCAEGRIPEDIATELGQTLCEHAEEITTEYPGYQSYEITQTKQDPNQQPKVTAMVHLNRVGKFARQFPQIRPLFAHLKKQGFFRMDGVEYNVAEFHFLWQRGRDVPTPFGKQKDPRQTNTKGSSSFGWHQDTGGNRAHYAKTVVICLEGGGDGNGVQMAGRKPVIYDGPGHIFVCDSDAMHRSISGCSSRLAVKIAVFLEAVGIDREKVKTDALEKILDESNDLLQHPSNETKNRNKKRKPVDLRRLTEIAIAKRSISPTNGNNKVAVKRKKSTKQQQHRNPQSKRQRQRQRSSLSRQAKRELHLLANTSGVQDGPPNKVKWGISRTNQDFSSSASTKSGSESDKNDHDHEHAHDEQGLSLASLAHLPRVRVDWLGQGTFYFGHVLRANSNGTYSVQYDDGDVEENVPRDRITNADVQETDRDDGCGTTESGWAMCRECSKWRRLSVGVYEWDGAFECAMNTWGEGANSCDDAEDTMDAEGEEELFDEYKD